MASPVEKATKMSAILQRPSTGTVLLAVTVVLLLATILLAISVF